MRSYILPLFLVIVFLSGCVKTNPICGCVLPPYQAYYLKAKVSQTSDISCSKPVLDFTEDSLHIRSVTGRNDLHYIGVNLPVNFVAAGKKLYVSVLPLKAEEDFPCNTLGIAYPKLKVLDAKNRE